jgi:hypothetical protein
MVGLSLKVQCAEMPRLAPAQRGREKRRELPRQLRPVELLAALGQTRQRQRLVRGGASR